MDKEKEERLFARLRAYGSVVVALSGGVDSAVLLMAAQRALGAANVAAVTATSELLAHEEMEDAKCCASLAGVALTLLPAADLASPDVARNDERRCYYCKKRRFELLVAWAKERGYRHVLDGTNVDDALDYRPGLQAIEALAPFPVSPSKEAHRTKRDTREA
ncbi:asparagine synthase-related protein, partial [uncultured Selenomonas sp.]|uniref:asparagine synthase-related protein n=1 Tax=uncultured Selenomonas sp. TaxID=159275 RepID=UPI0028DCD4B5